MPYARRIFTRLLATDRYRFFRITDWVRDGQENLDYLACKTIEFDAQGAWIEIDSGLRVRYLDAVDGAGADPSIYSGNYEPILTKICLELIPKNGSFVDVGANLGWYSLHAAFHKQCNVLAIEPNDFIRRYLKSNVEKNKLTKIEIEPFVMWSAAGENLSFRADALGHALSHVDPKGKASNPVFASHSLDALKMQHRITTLDLIKVDAEGADLKVLQGGEKLLKSLQPNVVFECSLKWMSRYDLSVQDLGSFLEKIEYQYRAISNEGRLICSSSLENDLAHGENVLIFSNSKANTTLQRLSKVEGVFVE